MALQTILVAASGGTASDGAVELACRVAAKTGARLKALHVKPDPAQVVAMMANDGFGMPLPSEWYDRFVADSNALEEKTMRSFKAVAERHKLTLEEASRGRASASWRTEIGYAPVIVARQARFADLVVLGRSGRVVREPHSDTIEETLLGSGRPVLLAPAKLPETFAGTVAIGWNGTPQAVHAIASSLPLVAMARTVLVITVGDGDDDASALLEYLAAHATAATHQKVLPVSGVGPGEQLLAHARDVGADLLVMGAYGHRPWREAVFGGATRHIVGTSLLPILLAH